jgi:quercetin dioxygenase-like cupin family protein
VTTPQNPNPRVEADRPLVRRGKLVGPDGGVAVWWMGDDRIRFTATSEDTGGAYAFWIDEPPAGAGPPKHVHSREEEGFYVISGRLALKAGFVEAEVGPGTFFALPRGIPHQWRNISDGHATVLTFTAGAGNEGFFLELGASGDGPVGERKTMPVDEINARTLRYGVTYMENSPDPLEGALPIGEGRSPTLVRAGEGERFYAAGATYTIKASGPSSQSAYTLTEIALEPGAGLPAHRHARYEEGIYVLQGTIQATIDERHFSAPAGSFLIIPWGVAHELRNASAERAVVLGLTTPGGLEHYLRTACHPLPACEDDREADLKRLAAVGRSFGIASADEHPVPVAPAHA